MRPANVLTLAFGLAVPLAGCATASAPGISDRELRAADVNGAPTVGDRPLTLRLSAGQASGSSGCNSFTASYRLSGDELEFGPIGSTRMACEAQVMDQESRYLAILDAAENLARYGDGSVSVIAPDGRAIRFRPVR
jgi:heat shock protein HslJ